MPFPARWKSILKKHMDAVPHGSPFPRYKQAVKDASAEYHGRKRNPDQRQLVTLGLVGLGGYVAYKAIKGQQQAPTTPASQPNTGLP